MTHAETIIALLKDRRKRITNGRRAIIEIFSTIGQPLAPVSVLALLRKKRSKMNKTTVYREIDFLHRQGILRALQFHERSKRYELASDRHTHHLICTDCQRIEDAVLDHDLDAVEKRLKTQKQFHVQHHSLEFYGLCKACQ